MSGKVDGFISKKVKFDGWVRTGVGLLWGLANKI